MVDQLIRPSVLPDTNADIFSYNEDPDAWKRRVRVITCPQTRTALTVLEKLQAEAYRLDIEAASYRARETCQRILGTSCRTYS